MTTKEHRAVASWPWCKHDHAIPIAVIKDNENSYRAWCLGCHAIGPPRENPLAARDALLASRL